MSCYVSWVLSTTFIPTKQGTERVMHGLDWRPRCISRRCNARGLTSAGGSRNAVAKAASDPAADSRRTAGWMHWNSTALSLRVRNTFRATAASWSHDKTRLISMIQDGLKQQDNALPEV